MNSHSAETTSPVKICHLFMSREFGGLEKHVVELSGWQAAHTGAQVFVIAHPRYRKHFTDNVSFIPVNTDLSRRNPLLYLSLLRACRQYDFDLMHGHGGKAAAVQKWLHRFTRCAPVITRHNIVHPKDSLAAGFPQRIAVSRKAVAVSALDWTIIPNGTHPPQSGQPRPQAMAADKRAVLAVARLVPAKGIDLLLQAWASVAPAGAILYLVGDGPDRGALEAQATALGVDDSVRFIGFSTEVSRWMQAAEFMVVSSHKEGAPYTVVEALLCGCPVISTDVGSNAELLPAAYVAGETSAEAIATLLDRALADPVALRDAFEPVFQYATEHLNVAAMARATWAVYRQALGRELPLARG